MSDNNNSKNIPLPPLTEDEKDQIRDKLSSKYGNPVVWRPSSISFLIGTIEGVRRGDIDLDTPICTGCKLTIKYLLSINKLIKYTQ